MGGRSDSQGAQNRLSGIKKVRPRSKTKQLGPNTSDANKCPEMHGTAHGVHQHSTYPTMGPRTLAPDV